MKHQARTDALLTTLHDLVVAYRKEGTTEARFAAIEGVIGEQSEEVLKQCEEHLAYLLRQVKRGTPVLKLGGCKHDLPQESI